MLYHLKITLRNLRRDKFYSAINIGGLAIALTACILILLWAWDELSFDRFHRNAAHIYRVNEKNFNGYSPRTREAVGFAAAAEIPEIEKTCRVGYYYGATFWEYDNNRFYTGDFRGAAVDTSFFNMFDFKIVRGNPFTDHFSMVISESKAKIIFGNDDPIGKLIKSSHNKWFHIIGVMNDMPQNTHFRYDYLVPFIALQLDYQRAEIGTVVVENWRGAQAETFFQLRPEVDVSLVANKISNMATRRTNNEKAFILQPLLKLHLFSTDGQPEGMKTAQLFCVIAALILLIACINYVNLVTARASKRSKEMSMKKIVGGKRRQLMTQLTGEAVLLFFVALALSTIFVYLLFPSFNGIAGKEMKFSLFSSPVLWVYGITTAAVILLTGLYPAIHLSSFKPLDVFRGGVSGQGKHKFLRKSLVVVQFVFSSGLIVAIIVIGSQLNYMRKKDLGYDKENVFIFSANDMYMHYDMVKNELSKNPNIIGVSGSLPGFTGSELQWDGKESNDNPLIFQTMMCHDFFRLMNVQLISGEYLSEHDNKYVLVNEEAIRVMGMDNPTGKRIWSDVNSRIDFTIKGVVKDYNFESLREPVKPLMFSLDRYPFNLYVKTVEGGAKSALASVENLWNEYNYNHEFKYSFLEDQFDHMYKSDLRVGKILYIFSFIAIFVSCLGLFGMVTYTAETKTKEIGIRKVMGASISNIVSMLSKEFLILVVIAMLIAFPLAYYWLDKMLQDYAFRIEIGWWMFAIAGIIIIMLALITVGWQAIKAATANPVKALKME
jgi:putative ABC transport system permease protein